MKHSLYNYLSYINGSAVLYNALSDEMALLEPTLAKMYQQQTLEEIHGIHPTFYEFLISKGFIVDDTTDEFQQCIDIWEQDDNDPSRFSITINPTLDCNMRCWYCYERHDADRSMDETVLRNIIQLIEIKTSDPKLKFLHLSFFGGEPLLKYNTIVQPLIERAQTLCNKWNVALSIGFVTNGFLLNSTVISYLSEIQCPVHLQITMDGNRAMHNNTRHTSKGFGSYDIILSNLGKVIAIPHVTITLRFNYTRENLDSFYDLVDDLETVCNNYKNSLTIDFQKVWQDTSASEELEIRLQKVSKAFSDKEFAVSSEKGVTKFRCYADRNNHVVINYDGNIFHCTARDFTPETSEGILNSDGSISFNEKTDLRSSLKWGNVTCRGCKAYPICHGGCSQYKLDSRHISGCIMNYDTEQINQLIEKRVHHLINISKVCSKQ